MDSSSVGGVRSDYNASYVVKDNDMFNSPYKDLVAQCDAEYLSTKKVFDPKVSEWQRRLKIYNNQRRDRDAVGDTLLFDTMQTVLASLYEDQMITEFTAKNEGDEDQAEAWNHLADTDRDEMKKDVFDYFWGWDTAFFGHSIVYYTNFVRDRNNTPIPDRQNPMLFYHDSKAFMVNGDPTTGRNACRFFGRWIEKTRYQMEADKGFFDLDFIKASGKSTSEVQLMRQTYQDASGLNQQLLSDEKDFKTNQVYELLEWATHYKNPDTGRVEKCFVTLANDRRKVVKINFLKQGGKAARRWPIVDRLMYPTSDNWEGTSIPDIIEDKQRMRAVLMNLAVKHVKADLYPMYVFNRKRFKNKENFNFDFNKFIPAEGEGSINDAIAAMPKAQLNAAVHQYIMGTLKDSAEQASATSQIQKGKVNSTKRTATEINKTDQNTGTRYSLTAKVWGWSEKEFWGRHYELYEDHFDKDIDDKIVRIQGPFRTKFRPLSRSDIIPESGIAPDITVKSKVVVEAKRAQQREGLVEFMNLAIKVPEADIKSGLKELGELLGIDKEKMDVIFPLSLDEMIAEDENDKISKNIKVDVKSNDNHRVHLIIHRKAKDTDATFAHVESHKHAIELMRTRPDLFQQQGQQQNGQPGQQPGQPQPGQQGQQPMQQQPPQLGGGMQAMASQGAQ